MKNISKVLSRSFVALLAFSLSLTPSIGVAANSTPEKGPSCDSFCGNTKDGISQLIQDSKCKSDPACVSCVGNTLGQSQIANYCTAYSSTAKSNKKQGLSATMFYATGGICLTSCILLKTTPTMPAGRTLARVCSGMGIATAAFDVISALTSNDPTGAVMGAIGMVPGIGGKIRTLKTNANKLTGEVQEKAVKEARKASCISGVTFLALGIVKGMSAKKMKTAAKAQCDIIGNFGKSANSAVQSCQLGKIPTPSSTGGAGMFAATASTFGAPTIDDGIKQLGLTAADQFIKDMRGDFKTATDLGKLDFPEIARKVDDGASASEIMGTFGLPQEVAALANSLEKRIMSGEKIPSLDALNGGGYSASGAGTDLAGNSPVGADEIAFATKTAPGEGVENLDIDRAPASVESGLTNDGDILHSAFNGSIFDIVSMRIKEQKSQYAEAEMEGRMNRAFNGFSNRERQPATSKK